MDLYYTLVKNEDGESNITLFVPGEQPRVAHSSHPEYEKIVAGVLAGDESVIELFDLALSAAKRFDRLSERVMVSNGKIYFDGEVVDNALTAQVVRFLEEDVEDWKPLVNFFELVMQNPNEHSRNQLFEWIQTQNLSITPEGLMIGYKGVKKNSEGNLVSCTAGRAIANGEWVEGNIPNEIGTYVEMPRTEVMHNPRSDCDAGLHVGSYSYAKGYGTVLIEVHVNPRDVVSVPDSAWKLRTCRYKVIGILKDEYTTPVVAKSKATTSEKPKAKAPAFKVKKGDIFEDTDTRRQGRSLRIESVDVDAGTALVTSLPLNIKRSVSLDRLNSRKYRRAAI